MALAPCRECGEEVSTAAKACPHCGASKPIQRRGIGCPLAIALVLLFLLAIGYGTRANEPKRTAEQIAAQSAAEATERQEFTAEAFCKDAALQQLKSPATAQWGDESDNYRHTDSPGHWRVQLQVDAENSFGALMRTTVDCKVAERNGTLHLTSIKSWGR